jgi:predicted secreted protein
MVDAINQQGITLTTGGTTIARIFNVSPVNLKWTEVDVTAHDSPSGFPEKILGRKDMDQVTVSMYYVSGDAGQVALATAVGTGASAAFVLTMPDDVTATVSFNARVQSYEFTGQMGVDGAAERQAVLTLTGVATYAETASNNITALTLTTATIYPTFAAGTYSYAGTCAAASFLVTATFAAGTGDVYNGTSHVAIATTVQSTAIALGANGSLTTITITITETGKVAKVYTINMARTA